MSPRRSRACPAGRRRAAAGAGVPASSGFRSSTSLVLVTATSAGTPRRRAEHEDLGAVAHGGADSLAQPDREGRLRVRDARAVAGLGALASRPTSRGARMLFQRRLDVVGADLAQSGAHAPAPELALMMYRGVMVWVRYASDRSE